jgi:branched-chain amino acid transport system ATP-binding protein
VAGAGVAGAGVAGATGVDGPPLADVVLGGAAVGEVAPDGVASGGGAGGVASAGAGGGGAGSGGVGGGRAGGARAGLTPERQGAPAAGPAAFGVGWQARGERTGGRGGPLLECAGLNKDYGGLHVLKAVTLDLPARGLFGLCGPNGAGKSTLLNVIGGSVRPESGQVLLDGDDITRLPPAERFHRGVSRTFQTVRLIGGRTVLDNVAVSCLTSHRSSITRGIVRNRLAEARDSAARALDYLGMGGLAGREVSSLTLETQRMVELARAIAPMPRLLLLDEPASGLSEPQRERLSGVLRTVAGMTCVLLVEHDLGLVAQITEKIFVLASGQLVFAGSPGEFSNSDMVNSLLIGLDDQRR